MKESKYSFNTMLKFKQLGKFFLSAAMLIFAICIAFYTSSSFAGNGGTLSATTEHDLGQKFMRMVRANFTILHDPLLDTYLQNLGKRLVAHSNAPGKRIHLFIIGDPSINAFSGPAGYIGVNTGLITATRTESELAAVLAHEIAHVTQNHILRGMARQKKLVLPELAALAVAIALGATAHSASAANAASGAVMATMAGGAQYTINFTRAYEKEADRIGMQILYKSGFDPHAMANFFARSAKQNLDYGNNDIPQTLLTHPVTAERIAEAQNRTSQYAKRKVKSGPDYYLMQARLKALTNQNNYGIYDYFKAGSRSKNPNKKAAAQYGYALVLLNNRQFAAAKNHIHALLKKYPKQTIYQLALAKIQTRQKNPQAGLATLKKALFLKPNYYPLIMQYAETLIAARKFTYAENFLSAQTMNYPNDPALYQLLSKAQAKVGHLADAYRSRAKVFTIYGHPKAAALQREQARRVKRGIN